MQLGRYGPTLGWRDVCERNHCRVALITFWCTLWLTGCGSSSEDTNPPPVSPPQNSSPVIVSFSVEATEDNASEATYSWQVSDPDGDELTCTLDVMGNSSLTFDIEDCGSNSSLVYQYDFPGRYLPVLRVSDGGLTAREIIGFSIPSNISFGFIRPVASAIETEDFCMDVFVDPLPDSGIVSVSAVLAGTAVDFEIDDVSVCGQQRGFDVLFPLDGVPAGNQVIQYRVEDGDGNVVLEHRLVYINRPPSIKVNQPLQGTPVRTTFDISFECSDPDEQALNVTFRPPNAEFPWEVDFDNSVTLERGDYTDSVDLAFALGDTDEGVEALIEVVCSDVAERSIHTATQRRLWLGNSSYVSVDSNFDGPIMDANDELVLLTSPINFNSRSRGPGYIETPRNSNQIQLFDRGTGELQNLSVGGADVGFGHLIPGGAWFEPFRGGDVFQWRGGELTELARNVLGAQVVGNFAVLIPRETQPVLFDLATDQTFPLPIGASVAVGKNRETDRSLLADGRLSYALDRHVFLLSEGVSTQISMNENLSRLAPITDGNLFLFKYESGAIGILNLQGEERVLALAPGRNIPILAGSGYQMNSGWVAYQKENLGRYQVWTRSPMGTETQRSFFGGESAEIEYLSDDGQVMFLHEGSRYLSRLDGSIARVGQSSGDVQFEDGRWTWVLGRSTLSIDVEEIPSVDEVAKFDAVGEVSFSDNTLHFSVVLGTSRFEIQSIIATFAETEAPLNFDEPPLRCPTFSPPPCRFQEFSLAFDASDIPRGQYPVTITLTDVFGNTQAIETTVSVDRPPELQLLAPLNESVATPTIPAQYSCIDDDQENARMLVEVGTRVIDELPLAGPAELDLSEINGIRADLRFRCVDSVNQSSEESRRIYVDSSSALRITNTLPGPVLDADADRVFYKIVENTGELPRVFNRLDGSVEEIPDSGERLVAGGFLTPNGAIYGSETSGSSPDHVLEWRDGVLTTLTTAAVGLSGSSFVNVNGDFAMFAEKVGDQFTTYLREFSSGTLNTVAVLPGYVGSSLGPNGIVALECRNGNLCNSQVVFTDLQAGPVQLTNNPDSRHSKTLTDGNIFVYRVRENNERGVRLHDRISEAELVPLLRLTSSYLVNQGYVAVAQREDNGATQIFLRAPDGQELDVATLPDSANVEAMSESGEFTIIDGDTRWLYDEEQGFRRISSDLGSALFFNDQWHVRMGRVLFEIQE